MDEHHRFEPHADGELVLFPDVIADLTAIVARQIGRDVQRRADDVLFEHEYIGLTAEVKWNDSMKNAVR